MKCHTSPIGRQNLWTEPRSTSSAALVSHWAGGSWWQSCLFQSHMQWIAAQHIFPTTFPSNGRGMLLSLFVKSTEEGITARFRHVLNKTVTYTSLMGGGVNIHRHLYFRRNISACRLFILVLQMSQDSVQPSLGRGWPVGFLSYGVRHWGEAGPVRGHCAGSGLMGQQIAGALHHGSV